MPIATPDDVSARLGRTIEPDEMPRIQAFIDDATAYAEDYCGRDFARREAKAFSLSPSRSWDLTIPLRYRTGLVIHALLLDGVEVADWTRVGNQLVRNAGWAVREVTVMASWGYVTPPGGLRGAICAEVIRWLAVAPGIVSEKVGDIEVQFGSSSTVQALSPAARSALSRYKPPLSSIPMRPRAGLH